MLEKLRFFTDWLKDHGHSFRTTSHTATNELNWEKVFRCGRSFVEVYLMGQYIHFKNRDTSGWEPKGCGPSIPRISDKADLAVLIVEYVNP